MVRNRTRDEILAAAARQFAGAGYKATSLHDIAVDVGCSKAALLYHFASKESILAELCAPAIAELGELSDRIEGLDPPAARAVAIEGFVDLVMRYRKEIQVIYGNFTALLQQPELERINVMTRRLHDAFAGPSGTPAAHIAAKLVLAGLPPTAFGCTEHSDEDLRAALVESATRALAPLT